MKKYGKYIILIITSPLTFLVAQNIITESVTDSVVLFRMNEIVVEANRIPALRKMAMHEIEAQDIRKLDSRDPVEALSFAPGVHIFNYAGNGETGFMIRGYEQRHISVFIDGVPIGIPYDGKVDISQYVGNDLETIRITRGNSSTLYGANAQGGSVNILSGNFTKGLDLRARIEGRQDGAYYGSASIKNNIGSLYYGLNFSLEQKPDFPLSDKFQPTINQSGDVRNNSAYNKKSAGVKFQYKINPNHQLGLNFTTVKNSLHIPPSSKTSRVRYWRFPEWESTLFSLKSYHAISDLLLLRAIFYYDGYYSKLQSFDDDSYSTQNERYAWDSVYDDYSSGIILYPTFSFFSIGATTSMISYKKEKHRQNFNYQGFEEYSAGAWTFAVDQDIKINQKWSVAAGVNINYLNPIKAHTYEVRNAVTLINGQATGSYKKSRMFSFYGSIGKKSRFPTMKELYSGYLDKVAPSPNLKEESALNTEIGMRITEKGGHFQTSIFYNKIYDLIAFTQIGGDKEQLQNIGKALLAGVELDLRYRLGDSNTLINYTYLIAKNQSDVRNSNQLPNRPRHRVNFIERWIFYKKMHIAFESTIVVNQYYQNPEASAQWARLNNYALFNFKLSYDLRKSLSLYLRVNNILDENYETNYGFPAPGRELIGGLKIHL